MKCQTLWVGYKVHLTETCDGQTLHLIAHVETTSATTQDDAVTGTIHQALALRELLPQAHLVDTGYTPVAPDTSWQARGRRLRARPVYD
jgi:transposase